MSQAFRRLNLVDECDASFAECLLAHARELSRLGTNFLGWKHDLASRVVLALAHATHMLVALVADVQKGVVNFREVDGLLDLFFGTLELYLYVF